MPYTTTIETCTPTMRGGEPFVCATIATKTDEDLEVDRRQVEVSLRLHSTEAEIRAELARVRDEALATYNDADAICKRLTGATL